MVLRVKRILKRLIGAGIFVLFLPSTSLQAVEYSASFQDADINQFINIVGKNLQKTIVLDPAVRGKINVRSYDVLNEKQYYQFFLSVLEVYGFAVVEMESGILKVIKAKDAKVAAIPVVDGGSEFTGDEMVTRVVPVINVSVRELAPLLRQLNDNAGGGNVVHYDPSNVIMLTGRAAVVNRLVNIIERVDKAGDQEVDIVKLKFASALEMVNMINSIQTNSTSSKKTSVSVLQPRLVADERTNSVIISGEPQARERVITLINSLDNELKNNGNTRVFYLKYANAQEVVDVLKGVSKGIEQTGGKTNSSNQSSLNIEAHEGTNSIVISAQPALMSSLTSIIRQLDIRRAQVLVEAIVVEVSEGDGINLSVQWASSSGAATQFSDNGASISALATGVYAVDNDEDDYEDLSSALGSIAGGIAGFVTSDWAAILQALSSSSTSNILATPSLTTLDNQEASFIVGDEVPVLTGSTSSSTNDNPFQTIERREVGIKLKVTPQINQGNSVQLTIEQEVSNIKGQTSVDIIFATRAVKTTVLAKSGETIIIGGLIDEAVSETIEKVPLLGDIPYLGVLFRSTKSTTTKRNLMIFLRPTIIRDDQTMLELSQRKYGLMRAIQQEQSENGIMLMPNTSSPVLPEWGQPVEIDPSMFDRNRSKQLKENDADEKVDTSA
ncbi:type II secretion system secretin GspD [Psychromonas algicola]|uniref:type II secretion system secretin GspD n=1 Tax=Psychromonas algicola TaxID=2555642 RepID=UPI001067F606|nr:type II secretion system secretin GspD [Psychromonas sp. RZ5]TEW52693.1 type II secretion system protein GspD [Psychromonas sp. RZ5]